MSVFDLVPTHELKVVHRQALDNPSLALANQYRMAIDGAPEPTLTANGTLTITSDQKAFDQQIREYFLRTDGEDHRVKVLTYTNRKSNYYNKLVRDHLQPSMATEPVFKGEVLTANSPVFDVGSGHIQVPSEGSVEVLTYTKDSIPIGGEHVDVLHTKLRYEDSLVEAVVCAEPEARAATLNRLKARALEAKRKSGADAARSYWREYFGAQERLADLRPTYSCTVHKAQGGTLDAVFVDADDIHRCTNPTERYRLMYVGLTRTRDLNHLLWSGK